MTSLHIGVLEKGFGGLEVRSISKAFPDLECLQVLAGENVLVPLHTYPSSARPLFPNVAELHVGIPWHYFPRPTSLSCHLLLVLSYMGSGPIFPQLDHLAVEKNVVRVPSFIRKHGQNVKSLACGSGHGDVLGSLGNEPGMTHLRTVVLQVDASCCNLTALPTSVSSIVLNFPKLQTWRVPRDWKADTTACLDKILELGAAREIGLTVGLRHSFDEPWLAKLRTRFDSAGIPVETVQLREYCHIWPQTAQLIACPDSPSLVGVPLGVLEFSQPP